MKTVELVYEGKAAAHYTGIGPCTPGQPVSVSEALAAALLKNGEPFRPLIEGKASTRAAGKVAGPLAPPAPAEKEEE